MPDDSTTPQLAEELVPPDLRWRLRLLISVDLVGSTALKQRSAMSTGDLEPWLPWFQGFYDGFEGYLAGWYQRLPEALTAPAPSALPTLWKYNGDEVLLHVCLADYREALVHVVALKEAVCRWRDQWAEGLGTEPHPADEHRKHRFPLDIKATAWVAGFPVTNAIVGDPEHPADFVGPQVDLGFRLAKLASRTRVVLDPALAHMVAEAMSGTDGCSGCHLVYLGRHTLEGILEGLPYPVFAVPAPHALVDAERALRCGEPEPDEPAEPATVVAFCKEFYRDTTGVLRPFIWQDAGGKFGLDEAEHELLAKRRAPLIEGRVRQGYVPPEAADPGERADQRDVDDQLEGDADERPEANTAPQEPAP